MNQDDLDENDLPDLSDDEVYAEIARLEREIVKKEAELAKGRTKSEVLKAKLAEKEADYLEKYGNAIALRAKLEVNKDNLARAKDYADIIRQKLNEAQINGEVAKQHLTDFLDGLLASDSQNESENSKQPQFDDAQYN